MTITVTLGKPDDLDAEGRRLRALRAKEVLNGAGWLFDEYISGLTRAWLGTTPADAATRENLWHQIDAAGQIKGSLQRIIDNQEVEDRRNERRSRNEPPADHE